MAGCVFYDVKLAGWLCLSHGSFVVDICLEWRGRIGDCVAYGEFPRLSHGAVQSDRSVAA